MNGEIVWYSPKKRYGFVAPDDGGGDIFFCFTDHEVAAFGPIERGMGVHFALSDGPGGPAAIRLAPGIAPAHEI